MPYYVATRVLLALKDATPPQDAHVLMLGVTFKRDIEDYRDSPALKIIDVLEGT